MNLSEGSRSTRLRGATLLSTLLAGCVANVQTETPPATSESVVSAPAPSGQESQQEPTLRQPVLLVGSGSFLAAPAPPAAAPQVEATQGYQLSFVESDIPGVVASVIGDALGLPYLVDPQVKGTMTLQVARPLAREEVLPALEASLSIYGAALVNVRGVYNVVPLKDAPRRVTEVRMPGATDTPGFGVQIVPLKYASAVEMEKVLRPFAPDSGILRVDESRNLLVLAGSSGQLATMRELVATFDADWLAGMSFALYPVEYVDAKTLVDELSILFGDNRSPIANLVRFVPLPRLNSVLVMTHEPSYLQQAQAWIRRLDIGTPTPGRRIYVYDVQNGKADDLADSLGSILSVTVEGAARGSESRGPRLFESSSGESTRSSADGPTSSFREERSVGSRASTNGSGSNSQELRIVPNVENNSLLMYATPSEFATIENALKRLDVPPIQVLIEASLAEVSLNDDLRYGLQWSFQGGDGPVVLSEASNGGIGPQFPGFSYLFTGRSDIRAVLNAIETVTDVNVISSPKLLVLNNREAELQIGDQVPITVQSAVGTTDDTPAIVNSVQLRDTGVILRITPRVNRTGMVLLDVSQEVSDVVPTTTSNIDSPTIQQRRIASTIAVRDGETAALGGLIRNSSSRTRGGVPLLTKVPLVGGLFGSTSNNNRRTELIVLITPRVIRSKQESEKLLDDLTEEFGSLREFLDGKRRTRSPVSGSTPAPSTPVSLPSGGSQSEVQQTPTRQPQ